jgi:co-chaperonin GroES (HSP10)
VTKKDKTMPAALMDHGKDDPKQALLDKVGNLDGIECYGSDVLVAVYMRPEKTRAGIILTDAMRGEDAHQGKVGLIVKMGPTAYRDEEGNKFRDIDVGQWAVFRSSDGWPVLLNTENAVTSKDAVLCRIINDINIRMTVAKPDAIF